MNNKINISSSGLHILAMILMLCDHLWATLFIQQEWLTCIGRITFPIFAFMIVEGYFHTKNIKKYLLRLFISALISEIPFNLMYASSIIYPYHQNVIWLFFIGLLLIIWMERIRNKINDSLLGIISCIPVIVLGFILGYAFMLDYYGVGMLTIFVFYFFRDKKWYNCILQLICLYILNVNMLGGYYYELSLFGYNLEITQQGFALLALLPIWLYNGNRGYSKKWFQYFCYAFYPLHMLILFGVRNIIL